MSKPRGKCVFCGNPGNLTKSHIWPDWVASMLPQIATHHERMIGKFHTFVPTAKGPDFERTVKEGHVATRKPRNTCNRCNEGWMRHIEEVAMPIMQPLLAGVACSLDGDYQRVLASFLCLVSMRIEAGSKLKSIPAGDRHWLMNHVEPPSHWKIWIAQYYGEPLSDERYTAMQIASSKNVLASEEHCNSQVTTLIIGKLCAHLFSSTDWTDFGGYEGVELALIWPVSTRIIDTWRIEGVTQDEVPWLHEAIARTVPHIRTD